MQTNKVRQASFFREGVACFCTALRFLTIVPVRWNEKGDMARFPASLKYFTLIGLLIGATGALVTLLGAIVLPPAILCCAIVLYLGLISGFLHLDGLADSADGLFSARPREKILTIMHDSRTGAMGVIALIFLLLTKFAALFSLPADTLASAVVFIPLAGRTAIVFSMQFFPYARKEGGLGSLFYSENRVLPSLVGLCVVLVAGFAISIPWAIVTLLTACVVTFIGGIWCMKMIGGITGDTLGAICEITETATAISLAILLNIQ
jgi:adenosylcobinamide-GDP ribazoletransferase